MKSIFGMVLLSSMLAAPAAFAQDATEQFDGQSYDCSLVSDCGHNQPDEPNMRVCQAADANGATYRYYTSTDFPITLTQRRAMEKCAKQSSKPNTCRVQSCHTYYN